MQNRRFTGFLQFFLCFLVMGKHRRKLGARRYADYEENTLEAALAAMRRGLSSRMAEEQFKIPRRTLLYKLKHQHDEPVGHPTALSVVEERHLVDVIKASAEYGSPMSKFEVRMLVKNYLDKQGTRRSVFVDNMPGPVWVENFLKRNSQHLTKRQCQNIKRSRAMKTDEEIMQYFDNLKQTLEGVEPQWILNYDETNLSDDPGSTRCIFSRGTKYPERFMTFSKSAISVMFAATAVGDSLPLYVVYKAERLYDRWVEGGPPKTIYNRTKSGWFDSGTFEDWFKKVVLPWAQKTEKPKVVIGDNLSSHLNLDVLRMCQRNNIKFVFLPANATHITQPLDISFFRPVKIAWRKILQKIKLEHPTLNCVDKSIFPQMLTKLVNELQPNRSKNIRSGFRAAGIHPLNPSEVLKKLPNERFKKQVSGEIDTALLDYLKQQRTPKEKITVNKKKQMLKVAPGCSMTLEELENRHEEPNILSCSADNRDLGTTCSETWKQNEGPTEEHSDSEESTEVRSNHEPDDDEENAEIDPEFKIQQKSFVIVQFPGKKKILHYLGVVLESEGQTEEDNCILVKFMKTQRVKSGEKVFVFPDVDDVSLVNVFDVKKILPPPSVDRRGHHVFDISLKDFDIT